ncbi:AhpC-TSA-domain-containing protein [Venustampulla echinocandica]|uniref:thioredoxin-dependent peroxiredoxin n=1 Tax=Venustampulla echinocandica TaxID=2656787 RepID=A0A370TRC6_9HELO|nr:AhpC-TSA-domain-containing protein [Venustampulla echinocandica]RDL38071.1 AhpC-TSA-domain-containing protein [Venustampulla echinocandica]
MPPTLRKRKAPAVEPATAPPAKRKGPVAKAVAKVKEAVSPKSTKTNGSASISKVAVGGIVDLDGFGGEIETNDGVKTTLKKLVDESKNGVVLFTYPKASTPGCTKQACIFRDQYTPLTSTGFSIYGLSKDSPKANTTFKQKQKLPYPLLCDPSATLISAIGLKKAPAGTTRGVFVIDKSGKVLAAQPGSPTGTVDIVEKLVKSGSSTASEPSEDKEEKPETEAVAPAANGVGAHGPSKDDVAQAEVASQVADTAEKLDSNEETPAAA